MPIPKLPQNLFPFQTQKKHRRKRKKSRQNRVSRQPGTARIHRRLHPLILGPRGIFGRLGRILRSQGVPLGWSSVPYRFGLMLSVLVSVLLLLPLHRNRLPFPLIRRSGPRHRPCRSIASVSSEQVLSARDLPLLLLARLYLQLPSNPRKKASPLLMLRPFRRLWKNSLPPVISKRAAGSLSFIRMDTVFCGLQTFCPPPGIFMYPWLRFVDSHFEPAI